MLQQVFEKVVCKFHNEYFITAHVSNRSAVASFINDFMLNIKVYYYFFGAWGLPPGENNTKAA